MKNQQNSESNPQKEETDLHTLIRITTAGFERMDSEFQSIDDRFTVIDARFTEVDASFAAINRRIDNLGESLSYKIDQLDAKVENYHQETKTDLAALRGVVQGMSHTLTDHEERIKTLEGE